MNKKTNIDHSEISQIRAIIYSAFANLISSPSDRTNTKFSQCSEIIKSLLKASEFLPYKINFESLRHALKTLPVNDVEWQRTIYSKFFEVGSDGPMAPLRAELIQPNQGRSKEEVVRFFEFFDYHLKEEHQWAPDHLAVLLEFIQTLVYKESKTKNTSELKSLKLGQRDFIDRHISSWLPIIIKRLFKTQDDDKLFYLGILSSLWNFLQADRNWQNNTIKV